ncbi:MAG: type II CAAX endopeptidase family protein [Bacteroidota bacterium]
MITPFGSVDIKGVRLLFDRHGDIRAGWRIVLFMISVVALAAALVQPMSLLPVSLGAIQNFVLLLAALGATATMTRAVNRKPFGAIGLALHHATFKELGVGCLLGFLMMTGIFLVGMGLGSYVPSSRGLTPLEGTGVAANALLWFGTGAMGEELLFRGYAFQTLIQAVTFLPATLLMSAVFVIAHMQNPGVTSFSMVNVALAGVLFSIAYMKTRSLWLPFGIHFAWNFSQTGLYGLPTSGVEHPARSLILSTQAGPSWISGGQFGPEGGILATIALVCATWFILKARYLAAPDGIITLDSVEDLIGPKNGEKKR